MYTITLATNATQTHKVVIDDEGVVTPPEGEVLKDGTWHVYEEKEWIGNLTVSGNEIGNVQFFPPEPLHGGGGSTSIDPFPDWPGKIGVYD